MSHPNMRTLQRCLNVKIMSFIATKHKNEVETLNLKIKTLKSDVVSTLFQCLSKLIAPMRKGSL